MKLKRELKRVPKAKSRQDTVFGAHKRPKWAFADGLSEDSGSAPACSLSALVKAAIAHIRRQKRNQRKGI
jgi:hypothetical protein